MSRLAKMLSHSPEYCRCQKPEKKSARSVGGRRDRARLAARLWGGRCNGLGNVSKFSLCRRVGMFTIEHLNIA